MPSYTYSTHNKLNMSKEYIEVGLQLFYNDKHYSALLLAGAADELLGDKLDSLGKPTALKIAAQGLRLFKRYLGLDNEVSAGKEIDFLNKAKNSCKHAKSKDRQSFEFEYHGDIKAESEERLEFAIKNYEQVHGELPETMSGFLMRNFKE